MRKVLIILFLALNTILSATNYYVKNGGNDSNSGLDDTHAWAHHPWMSTWTGHVTLAAGDNVYMKRGDTWSISSPSAAYMTVAQNGTSGNPITTTAYGTGAKPVIMIASGTFYPVIRGNSKSFVTFDNLDIKNSTATRDVNTIGIGIYLEKDVSNVPPHDWIITNCDIHNCPRTGIEGLDDAYNITIGDLNATSTATVSSYSNHIYNCGYAGVILSGINPATSRSDFNVYYNYVHDIDNTNTNRDAYGIGFTSNDQTSTGNGYSSGWPKYCTAKYNYVATVPGHEGIDCHGGSYIYYLNNYVKNCRTGLIMQAANRIYALTTILDHGYIQNNIVENTGNCPTPGLSYSFIGTVGESSTYRLSNVWIQNNTCFYTSRPNAETGATGITIYNADGVTVSGNNFYNGPINTCSGAMYFGSLSKNITISSNFIKEWGPALYTYNPYLDGSIYFNNNIINSFDVTFVTEGNLSSGANLYFYNNVLLSQITTSNKYAINFGSGNTITSGASIVLKNNIIGFTTSVSNKLYLRSPETITGTFTCDYNLYWNSTYANPFNDKYNLTLWKTFGYDNHSPNAISSLDPLFINASGTYSTARDFFLQSTSPAINRGTVVNEVNQDFFGNPRDATPDIGAYEYGVPVTMITVTGADGNNTITTDKGTLQLLSSIFPNGSSKTVTWSTANGTGQASISSSGLVTAITDGTVTAMATATDGSGVYGTLFITISNQVLVDPAKYNDKAVIIFPNPAHEYFNIRIVEQKLVPDIIRIINLTGKVVLQYIVNPDMREIQIPINLIEGIYILQMGSGNTTFFTQKLIVDK
jgi:hypothetical protein